MEQRTDHSSIITKLLEEGISAHLADCLDMVPEENLNAICRMIREEIKAGQSRDVVRYQVEQDVAAFVGGNLKASLFSARYMNASEQEEPVCGRCGNNSKALNKVSIPGIDIDRLCPDCAKTINMYENTVGVL